MQERGDTAVLVSGTRLHELKLMVKGCFALSPDLMPLVSPLGHCERPFTLMGHAKLLKKQLDKYGHWWFHFPTSGEATSICWQNRAFLSRFFFKKVKSNMKRFWAGQTT